MGAEQRPLRLPVSERIVSKVWPAIQGEPRGSPEADKVRADRFTFRIQPAMAERDPDQHAGQFRNQEKPRVDPGRALRRTSLRRERLRSWPAQSRIRA